MSKVGFCLYKYLDCNEAVGSEDLAHQAFRTLQAKAWN